MKINDPENVCPTCHQSIAYKSAVNRGLCEALKKILAYIEKKGVNAVHLRKELSSQGVITDSQHRNIEAHGVRLGLVAHIENEPGNYCLTTKGMDFLNGEPIPRYAMVQKRTEDAGSHTILVSAETCTMRDFLRKGDYWEVPGVYIQEGRVIKAKRDTMGGQNV